MKQSDELSYEGYLETFDVPVFLVDSNLNIVSANKVALALVEKTIDCVRGMSSGEVLACLHSRMSKKCGKTNYCSSCLMKILVLRISESRIPHHKFHVPMNTAQGKREFLVSASFIDGLVLLAFERTQ